MEEDKGWTAQALMGNSAERISLPVEELSDRHEWLVLAGC